VGGLEPPPAGRLRRAYLHLPCSTASRSSTYIELPSAFGTQCDAHHVQWWRHGGATDLQNLVLTCSAHHSGIHAGTWQLTIINGVPWVIPPHWLDPHQRPVRNTYPTVMMEVVMFPVGLTHYPTDASAVL